MHVDPTSHSVSPAGMPATSSAPSNSVSTLGITTLQQLGQSQRAGGTLTTDQRRHIVESIQSRGATQANGPTPTSATQRIDYASEFRTHGLRNIAVYSGGRLHRMDPNAITLDFVRRNIRNMAILTKDGVLKPVSGDTAGRLPPIGTALEMENPDGTKETVTIKTHLTPMSEDELHEFESHFIAYLETRQQSTVNRQQIQRPHQQLSMSTFSPSERARAPAAAPPADFVNNVVRDVHQAGERHDSSTPAAAASEERRQTNRHRVHQEQVEDERSDDLHANQ